MALFPTNAQQVQSFAVALYGMQVGTNTMAQVNTDIAAAGGLTNALNAYYVVSFGLEATSSVAARVTANLGITGEAATAATAYIKAQLDVAPQAVRGGVVTSILNLFSGMSADPTFGAAATKWNNTVANAVAYTGTGNAAPSTNYVLSMNPDVASANVFNAPRVWTPGGTDQMNSLNDDDVLTGTGTNPTLNVVLVDDADTGDQTITPTLINIETLKINDTDAQAPNLDLEDASGLKTVELRGMEDTLTLRQIINLPGTAQTLKVDGSGNDIDGVVFTYDNDADAATDANFPTEVSLTLSDVVAVTTGVQVDAGAKLKIESTGDANRLVNLNADDASTIEVTGDKNLTISAFSASAGVLSKIDATNFKGNLDIDLGANNLVEARVALGSGSDIDFNVLGGAGNDTIRVDNASLSAAPTGGDDNNGHDVVNGGAGTNTLDFTVGATANLVEAHTTVTNIQTVRIDATAASTATLNTALIGGLSTVIVRNEIAANGTASFDLNNLAATGVKVQVQHATDTAAGANTNSETAARTDVELNFKDASGAHDSATVEIITGTNDSEVFNFTLDVDGANAKGRADAGAVENLTIIDSDTEDNTAVVTSVADQTESITLTGGRAGDNFVLQGDVIAATVDATAQLSNVTVTLAGGNNDRDVGAQEVLLGLGNDDAVFTTSSLDENDSVDGGAGNDRVTALYTDGDEVLNLDLQLNDVEELALYYDDDATPDDLELNVQDNRNFRAAVLIDTTAAVAADANINGNPAAGFIVLETDTVDTIRYEGTDGDFNAFRLVGNDVDDVTVQIAIEAGNTNVAGDLEIDNVVNLTIDVSEDAEFAFNNNGILDMDAELETITIEGTGNAATLDLGAVDASVLQKVTADFEGNLTMAFANTEDSLEVTVTNTDTGNAVTVDLSNTLLTDSKVTLAGGDDVVTGSVGDDVISTGAGDDQITLTGGGSDIVTAGAGSDTITIEQGVGTSRYTGGTGTDTFVFESSGASGRITDFNAATETIDLDLSGGLAWTVDADAEFKGNAADIAAAEALLGDGDVGDWVFVTSTHTLYVDVNGDDLLTIADFSVVLTGVNSGAAVTLNLID